MRTPSVLLRLHWAVVTPYPFDKLMVRSPLPAERLQRRLEGAVGAPRPQRLPFYPPERALEGAVSGMRFRVWSAIGYPNPFQPVADGEIRPHAAGARLEATLRLQRFTAIAWAAWMTGVLALAAATAILGTQDLVLLLLPPALGLLGYLGAMAAFWLEVPRLRRTLEALARADRPRAVA